VAVIINEHEHKRIITVTVELGHPESTAKAFADAYHDYIKSLGTNIFDCIFANGYFAKML